MANLTAALEKERKRICKIAEDAGLDFFETIFELINYEQMNQVAAYGDSPCVTRIGGLVWNTNN